MKTIYKYRIDFDKTLELPEGSEVLSFQYQDEKPTIWVLVDTTKPLVKRHFSIYGTGWEVAEEGLKFIGTAKEDVFIWHLFEAPV